MEKVYGVRTPPKRRNQQSVSSSKQRATKQHAKQKHEVKPSKHPIRNTFLAVSAIGGFMDMHNKDAEGEAAQVNVAAAPQVNPYVQEVPGGGKWVISADFHEDLVNAGLNDQQISFVKLAAEANVTLANNGAPIQPAAVTAQNTFESNYGTDTLSGPGVYNFGGHKGPHNETDSVFVWTHEQDSNGNLFKVKQWFRRYPQESLDSRGNVVHIGSFVANASMIGRLDWYKDTVACGQYDPYKYFESLEFQLDPTTCQRTGVVEPAYASLDGDEYIARVMGRMSNLHLNEDITYQP